MRNVAFILLLLGSILPAVPARAEAPVLVFAAASLRGALEDAVAGWDEGEVVFSYGGSAAQARQVAQGAPADLVILAHVEWMDWLEGQGALVPESRRDLVGNRLVVVSPTGVRAREGWPEPALLADLPEGLPEWLGAEGRLAMGHNRSVPAGQYAREWLVSAGLWDDLAPRLAETENVRAALALVALGEVPLGIVYATDAAAEPAVRVVYDVPARSHRPIVYPAAQTRAGTPRAASLLRWLSGRPAAEVFARHGFDQPQVTQ